MIRPYGINRKHLCPVNLPLAGLSNRTGKGEHTNDRVGIINSMHIPLNSDEMFELGHNRFQQGGQRQRNPNVMDQSMRERWDMGYICAMAKHTSELWNHAF